MERHLYPKFHRTLHTQQHVQLLTHLRPTQHHLQLLTHLRPTQHHLPILHTHLMQEVIHHPYTQLHRHLPILPHHTHQHQLILHLHIHRLHKLHPIILQVTLCSAACFYLLIFNSSPVLNFPLFFNQALILERILHHLTKNGWSALIPKKKWLERLHSEMKGVNI